jgi:hypothetical protein
MILLTFDRALTAGDRERIKRAFGAVNDGDDQIVVVEEVTVTSDSETALTFSGIIT